MAIVDRHGLPLSVGTHAANHHEVPSDSSPASRGVPLQLNLSSGGRCTKKSAMGEGATEDGRAYDAKHVRTASRLISSGKVYYRQRHGEWSTSPFRRVRETHRERIAKVPTRPIRFRLHPIRNDCGSCRQRGLPSSAPSLSRCQACVFHLQAPAEVPAAPSSASQDATRRSPAAIWSSPQGHRRASYERALRRFRQG